LSALVLANGWLRDLKPPVADGAAAFPACRDGACHRAKIVSHFGRGGALKIAIQRIGAREENCSTRSDTNHNAAHLLIVLRRFGASTLREARADRRTSR